MVLWPLSVVPLMRLVAPPHTSSPGGVTKLVSRVNVPTEVAAEIPDAVLGFISGDVSSVRGQMTFKGILSGGILVLQFEVPLSVLVCYDIKFKSLSAGWGSYSMELSL